MYCIQINVLLPRHTHKNNVFSNLHVVKIYMKLYVNKVVQGAMRAQTEKFADASYELNCDRPPKPITIRMMRIIVSNFL